MLHIVSSNMSFLASSDHLGLGTNLMRMTIERNVTNTTTSNRIVPQGQPLLCSLILSVCVSTAVMFFSACSFVFFSSCTHNHHRERVSRCRWLKAIYNQTLLSPTMMVLVAMAFSLRLRARPTISSAMASWLLLWRSSAASEPPGTPPELCVEVCVFPHRLSVRGTYPLCLKPEDYIHRERERERERGGGRV